MFSDDDWAELPLVHTQVAGGRGAYGNRRRHGASADEGGFDRDEVHLSRTPLVLDQQGWQELNEALQEVAEQAIEIQARARRGSIRTARWTPRAPCWP